MGLILNTLKCELIAHQGVSVTDKLLQSFTRVLPNNSTLLGAPLFPGPVINQVWSLWRPLASSEHWAGCISYALKMHWSCWGRPSSAPKVFHLLHCRPSASHLYLGQLIRRWGHWCNASPIVTYWMYSEFRPLCQLTMVVWVWDMCCCLPFLPFGFSSKYTVSPGRRLVCVCSNNVFLQSYLLEWSSSFGSVPDTLPSQQPFWDRPGIMAVQALLKSSLNMPMAWLFWQPRLHAAVTGFLPCPFTHIFMSPETRWRSSTDRSLCAALFDALCLINATVEIQLMHVVFMGSSVWELQADWPGTRLEWPGYLVYGLRRHFSDYLEVLIINAPCLLV